MTSTVTWSRSIYMQVDHHNFNSELALGFKVFVVYFRAAACLGEQYLSQSALQTSCLRDDKDNQSDFIAEGTQAHRAWERLT